MRYDNLVIIALRDFSNLITRSISVFFFQSNDLYQFNDVYAYWCVTK